MSGDRKRLSVPLAGDLDVGHLQVMRKRDIDNFGAASKELAAVVVKLVRKVSDLETLLKRIEPVESLKAENKILRERVARLEKRLDERH